MSARADDKCLRCGSWPAQTTCMCEDGPVTIGVILAAIAMLSARVAALEERPDA